MNTPGINIHSNFKPPDSRWTLMELVPLAMGRDLNPGHRKRQGCGSVTSCILESGLPGITHRASTHEQRQLAIGASNHDVRRIPHPSAGFRVVAKPLRGHGARLHDPGLAGTPTPRTRSSTPRSVRSMTATVTDSAVTLPLFFFPGGRL